MLVRQEDTLLVPENGPGSFGRTELNSELEPETTAHPQGHFSDTHIYLTNTSTSHVPCVLTENVSDDSRGAGNMHQKMQCSRKVSQARDFSAGPRSNLDLFQSGTQASSQQEDRVNHGRDL